MSDFVGKLEFDPEASPGTRIIRLDNGFAIIPDQTGIDDGWSPFDADGNLRDDLEAEGWHRMGALKDGPS
ncbi:hypothetical protein [Mycolicibacterium llatzerense]|uniref:hypothetical protein n=1 Tax=Mycolicibacterium llatzerense TaxID=280871 RepID=UPI0021B6C462|nr:hypothetical protein [Mycolicibacterium llatzerense]MCT7364043.1 hypothetical protein [Mycolicibacterium llatzerense]